MCYLAVDLGEKRIGLAISDSLKMVASPLIVFLRRSRREDFAFIRQVASEKAVEKIIVGLPLLFSGEEGRMARWARDYGTALGASLGLPVEFWDETLTSDQAEEAMRAGGLNKKKMKGKLDAVAAALILQSFLDAEREQSRPTQGEGGPEPFPDDDM